MRQFLLKPPSRQHPSVPFSIRRDIPQDASEIGIAAYRDKRELTVGKLLALPFQKQRPWQLPTGKVPRREPKHAGALQL